MRMDLKDKNIEKNVEKNKHFLMSVEFALQGVKTVFDEERNMKKHVVCFFMLRSSSNTVLTP